MALIKSRALGILRSYLSKQVLTISVLIGKSEECLTPCSYRNAFTRRTGLLQNRRVWFSWTCACIVILTQARDGGNAAMERYKTPQFERSIKYRFCYLWFARVV